jgi:type II secretory pathway component PulF
MNYDEFGFFNQQLAAMLRDGIPLEGALKQLSTGMAKGGLRSEIQALEADLSKGTPLADALPRRQLPDLYRKMVVIGAKANDLPGVLTMVADHYQRTNASWTRLKGIMVYPVLVVLVALGLTLVISLTFHRFLSGFFSDIVPGTLVSSATIWIPPVFLMVFIVILATFLSQARWRARLRWSLPAFRDASLAQLASSMALLLKNGVTLPEALAMMEDLESISPARPALAQWRAAVESGKGKPSEWPATGNGPFPPLFLWLVQQSGENLASGFQRTSELYQARASHRIELLLYGALPVSIVIVGQMVLWQAAPLMRGLVWMMNTLGGVGG